MVKALEDSLSGRAFDYVFTHSRSPNGEYGRHANHVEVREAVMRLVGRGQIVSEKSRLAFFSYWPLYRGCGTCARLKAEDGTVPTYMPLTYDALAAKMEWIRAFLKLGVTGNPHLSIIQADLENIGWPCPNPEAFEGDGLQLPSPFTH